MSCACDYTKKVCLTPGVDAYRMTETSAGKICLGAAPLRFSMTLPKGNDPYAEPATNDPAAVWMQTYKAARIRNIFVSSIIDAAGQAVPRSDWDQLDVFLGGVWYASDNWMASVPTNIEPQDLKRGIPLTAFNCEEYVRCYGNPLPRQCMPTFKSNEDAAALTWGYEGPDVGPLEIRGMIVLDYGMVDLDTGACYMDNANSAVDPTALAGAQAALAAVQRG